MWRLVFICMLSVVGGVPINATLEDTSHATDNGTTMSDVQKQGSVIPLNGTQNMTRPATGVLVSMLEPQRSSSETLEGLEDDAIVQEGDILIPEDRNAVQNLWSDAVMPYTISQELTDRALDIHAAFKMISDLTCIRFRPHTTELNYIEFRSGKGCASYVGCVGGAQVLYSAPSCSVGNVCHEIIHALGLHHEHNRRDRDQYISVEWSNIMPGKRNNFEVKQGDTQNLPYDLNSIMHYGEYYFSQDGRPTVLSKSSGVQIGQRSHLSELDVLRLNSLYHCGND
ncbi:hatching enzyme 1.2-like isoform X1 [Pseudochaenichthys georgianus]|uniref:hatching enzyme 1.2-like isoform X1 n=2 Tax=Pseudochaenichthys georgianus TaxID=52239 RepID=UPI00146B769D|nr:zinc metalloproteinase nas-14-like isoform X1 [Pseudochaenichthys georgianus]